MREAIALTLFAVPGFEQELAGHGGDALPVWNIRVDETFSLGSATIQTNVSGAYERWERLIFRRFGEDWLVTAIEHDWSGGIRH